MLSADSRTYGMPGRSIGRSRAGSTDTVGGTVAASSISQLTSAWRTDLEVAGAEVVAEGGNELCSTTVHVAAGAVFRGTCKEILVVVGLAAGKGAPEDSHTPGGVEEVDVHVARFAHRLTHGRDALALTAALAVVIADVLVEAAAKATL